MARMKEIQRHHWRVDVSRSVNLPGTHEIAVDLVVPQNPRFALCCLPGGFLTRRYYDLETRGSRTYSFAEHMAQLGFATIALDHLGVGESTRPDEQRGFELGLEELARANHAAFEQVLERLRAGQGTDLPALPDLQSIGVGHSMGSLMTVVQQALTPTHAALVLFSFTTSGLPEFLTPEELSVADNLEQIRARTVELARKRFGSPWPQTSTGGATQENPHIAFQVGTAGPNALEALRKAGTNMLSVPGLLSMIPGAISPYADRIETPVFIVAGDHDLHGAHGVPSMFPGSPEAVAYTLEDSWHCHFVANPRARLWDRVAHWLRGAI